MLSSFCSPLSITKQAGDAVEQLRHKVGKKLLDHAADHLRLIHRGAFLLAHELRCVIQRLVVTMSERKKDGKKKQQPGEAG